MNIKCIIYARYSTSIPIHSINNDSSNSLMQTDAEKMPSKIKSLRSKSNVRDKLRTSYGVWYVMHDQNDIAYAVCTDEAYPERHAFGLINKIQQKIKEINHCQYETEENIKSYTKISVKELSKQYNDLSKIDKLHQANLQVKELESQLGTGIKKMIKNQETLEDMGEKAQKMKENGMLFEKNSQKLQRMMYWRNIKLKIIVGLFIVGLIGLVIMIIVQRTQTQNQ